MGETKSLVLPSAMGIILIVVGIVSVVFANGSVGMETAVFTAGAALLGWAIGSSGI